MKKTKFYLFFLAISIFGFSQNGKIELENNIKLDTSFYKDISNKLIIKINRDSKIDFYSISDQNNENFKITPNIGHNYSVSLDYKFLGLSLTLPQKWINNEINTNLKGETTHFNLNFTFFYNKWLQTIHYNKTKGYYIENTGDLIPNWQEGVDSYILFPNFKVSKIGGTTGYILNGSKFSYRSFLQQTQIQLKSVGSFIPLLSYEYIVSKNKLAQDASESYDKTFTSVASFGYQYNWVISKNFNFSGGFFPGLGFDYTKSNVSENEENNWIIKKRLNFNLNLNYQWRNFFCGLQFSSLNNYTKNDGINLTNSINYENIYLGYLFDAPKIIEKPINWIEKKLF